MFLLNLVFFCNFHEFIVYFTICKRLCTYKSFLFLLSLCLQSLSFFFSEGLTLFSVFSFSLHLLEKGYHQYEFQKRQVDLGRIGYILACIPLGWSKSGLLIRDHSEQSTSKDLLNRHWERITIVHLMYQDPSDAWISDRIAPNEPILSSAAVCRVLNKLR